MIPYLQLGNVQVDDVNVEEVAVDMALGVAVSSLIGIPVARIMLPEDGKHIIRLLFLLEVPILYPTARYSAFPAIRIQVLTAVIDK